MSSIDERIVSMKFDNKQFESGVATTLTSLGNLKQGLNLSGSAKGLQEIGEAANRVNFNGMSSALDSVKVKLSALQVIGVTALANIANSAINAGKTLISSFTLDPIIDGFKEYETQMNSIQTVLANTASQGTTLNQVTAALNELNTYSDKTIYNFTEMTKNIGTFTAAGVGLNASVSAIKGIANLAALSGSNSEQASSAMYQLSQALASGTVKLQDWNSVVNAGMGGKVFQDALMQTARVHGIAIDDMVKSEGSFRETLSKGWLTSSILTETLSKFTGDLNASQLKTMGYTDEQIAGIIKMGQTANDAATKVKTMSQLMDTLKEAVGSGWAQTWQIVFGNFTEAKELFTSVSNVLGGMINDSSKARNTMLQGWKDLGGRTVLITAIKNAFDGLMGIVKAVGEAFRQVFPATTSAQLFSLTQGLANLTSHLKLSSGTLTNLSSTFKGLFAILDVGKQLFVALAKSVGIIIPTIGGLMGDVLGVTGSFGEWLTAIDNVIKQSGIFSKVLTTLAYGIRNGFAGVGAIFETIIRVIGNVVRAIGSKINFSGFEAFHNLLELMGNRMSSVGTEAGSMSNSVGNAFSSMGKSIASSKIGELFTGLYNAIKMVAEAIGIVVGKMATAISSSLKNANFNSILDSLAAMSIGGMLLAFKKFMTSLSSTIKDSKGIFSNITEPLNQLRSCLESYQQNLKAGTLIKLGVAIALLAGSIVAISLIDSGKLTSSLAAIGTLFGQLLVSMKLFSLIGKFQPGIIKASVVMIIMSASILILSNAMKNMASLDWNGVAKGTVGIAALAGTLVATAKVLSSGSGAMIKGSSGMVIFALAIKVLASACNDLSNLSWNQLTKGLVGIGGLMAEISLFLNNTTFSAKSIATATGIVILAAAMKILASACTDFGSMPWSDISKGLISVGALLTELSIFTNATADAKNVISTGVALIAIAAAMKILASAMNDFGSMSWESIAKGLISMGVALGEIGIAVNLLPPNLPIIATGLVIVGAALKIIASALIDLGGMSWSAVSVGLVALGGALAILAVGLNFMTGTLAGSAALLVAAGALAILAPTLMLLGTMTWDAITKGLFDLAAVIAIFGVSALVLTPVIPSMIALSASLVLLGVSMLGIGAGLALVGLGLAGVATGFTLLAGTTAAGATAIVAALGIIVVGVAALIPQVMAKIGEGILAFIKVFTAGIPAILQCITTIIKAIVTCITTNIPVIMTGVLKTLSSILDAILKWTPTIVQKVVNIILAMLKVISDNIGKFVTAATNIIVGFIQGITNNLPRIIQAAFNLIITFVNGLATGIRNNSGALNNAGVNLASAVVHGVASLAGSFVKAGGDAVMGFINGLASMPGKLWNAGVALGKQALEAARNAINSHSPSKEFEKLGVYSVLGFVNGLEELGEKVYNAGANMGYNAIDSVSKAISGISDVVNDNIESNPVITPVLDLSNIQNGSNKLYSMMNGISDYSLDGSLGVANSTAGNIQAKQLLNNAVVKDTTQPGSSSSQTTSKKPITLQLMLQNGKAIAEFIVDDLDGLMGTKNKFEGRMAGL